MNTEYMPLSAVAHRNLRFKQGTLFFVQDQAVLPVSIAEAPRAALDLPLGFVRGVTGIGMVAICSLEAGVNNLLSHQGLWLGGYVPAAMASHPFAFVSGQEPGQIVVGVYLASNWLSREEGELLFDEKGQPGPVLSGKIKTLQLLAPNLGRDAPVLAVLDEFGLLKPWEGLLDNSLLRVDQDVLNSLGGAEMARLRDSHALAMVYAHFLSMLRIDTVREITGRRKEMLKAQAAARPSPDMILSNEIIRFG